MSVLSRGSEGIVSITLLLRAGKEKAGFGPALKFTIGSPKVANQARRADAAAVSAIASGSQHSTIKAISHRMASS